MANWKSWACAPSSRPSASSGNRAFDEYKAETLRRMEEEQKDFGAFLERLRFAKDKSEFDQFMADRRNRPPAPPAEEQPCDLIGQGCTKRHPSTNYPMRHAPTRWLGASFSLDHPVSPLCPLPDEPGHAAEATQRRLNEGFPREQGLSTRRHDG